MSHYWLTDHVTETEPDGTEVEREGRTRTINGKLYIFARSRHSDGDTIVTAHQIDQYTGVMKRVHFWRTPALTS